jgi:hypothetical protein
MERRSFLSKGLAALGGLIALPFCKNVRAADKPVENSGITTGFGINFYDLQKINQKPRSLAWNGAVLRVASMTDELRLPWSPHARGVVYIRAHRVERYSSESHIARIRPDNVSSFQIGPGTKLYGLNFEISQYKALGLSLGDLIQIERDA